MAGHRKVSVTIDGEKLRNIFIKRGVPLIEVSKTCGFEDSYFSKAIRANRMPLYVTKLLESVYHIPFEDYEVQKVEPELLPIIVEEDRKEVEFVISEETAKQLHQLIYSAVYEAVKRVWSE